MNWHTKICHIYSIHQIYAIMLENMITDHLFKHLDRHVKDKKFSNQDDAENDFLCSINSRSSGFVMVLISVNQTASNQNYDLSKFPVKIGYFICNDLIL